ncbi:MAG: hypothetical protein IKW74_07155, partial [Thermoguttaceae bacterium]|nr:hypothetical protein [Thermoguttaceae bacterium]
MSAKARKSPAPKTKTKRHVPVGEQNLLLLHGEKIGILIVLLIVVWMIAGGSGLSKFTLTPDQINQSTRRAEENIKSDKGENFIKADEYDKDVVVYDYNNYAHLIKTSIKVNAYETIARWDQSLFPDKNKRKDVTPLPVENLRAMTMVGGIRYRDENNPTGGMGGMGGGMGLGMGNSGDVKGRQWIVLTGSIPVRRQQAEYNNMFSSALYQDDYRDHPKYIFYELERGTEGDDGQIKWEKIDVIKAMKNEIKKWSGYGSEQVSNSYIAPVYGSYPPMAMNCPPVENESFGEEIANLPNIPLNISEQFDIQSANQEEMRKRQEAFQQIDENTILERDPFADSGSSGGMGGMGDTMGGMTGGMGGMGGTMGGMTGGMGGMGGTMGGMTGGMGGTMGGMGMGMSGNSSTPTWAINREASKQFLKAEKVASVDYYLFRYFDFDVKEGVTYVYRVKLILANPNYGIEERFVEDTSTLTKTTVVSEFSEPSNPVALGTDSRIFVTQVTPSSRPGQEPRASLSSVYFDTETATKSLVENQTVVRGQVANFMHQSHKPLNDSAGMGGMTGMMDLTAMTGNTGGKNKKKTTNKSVDHVSNVCVLDFEGGRKISGTQLRSPGKMIVLDPNGLVEVHEAKEDARKLEQYTSTRSNNSMMMG